jgi:predicted component of type VI protein secretion system
MSELTIEWQEAGALQTQTVSKTATIGRDPARCNIVLSHPTVSGLHAMIYFRDADSRFYLRNLRDSNPPVVDNKRLNQGEAPLHQGSKIYLGQVLLTVTQTSAHTAESEYGLKCTNPTCGRVSAYDRLKLVCPWCGTSLAAAPSVIMPPVKI